MKKNKLFLAFIFLLFFVGFGFAGAAIIDNPLTEVSTVQELIAKLFDALATIAEVALAFIIVLSGVRMITSVGNPEEMNKARNAIFYATIGIIVLLSADAILQYVMEGLLTK